MASFYHGRKTLLYADLFKCNKIEKQQEEESIMIMSKHEGSSSSLSSNKSFSCDSSSLGSELGSSENEDEGDFMAELTRQIAECMLQEEEREEEEEEKMGFKNSEASVKDNKDTLKYGLNLDDQLLPPHEVYELKNQPPIRKEGHIFNKGRRVKSTESTHRMKPEQQHYMQMPYRGIMRHDGSGMQAIFLDGSKSRNGSSGTGVFLPRATNDAVKPNKKSGCSTVLIPTRVLQALDLHFNRVSDSKAQPQSDDASSNYSCLKDKSNGLSQLGNGHANHDVEIQLPQEWTY